MVCFIFSSFFVRFISFVFYQGPQQQALSESNSIKQMDVAQLQPNMEYGNENIENNQNSPNVCHRSADYTPNNMILWSEQRLQQQWMVTGSIDMDLTNTRPLGIENVVDIENDTERNTPFDCTLAAVIPKMFVFGAGSTEGNDDREMLEVVDNPSTDKEILEVAGDSIWQSIYGHPSDCDCCLNASGVHTCGRRALHGTRRRWESDITTSSHGQFVQDASKNSKTTSTH